MRLVALRANSMHPAIVLAPPLHPPRPHPASSMPSVPLPAGRPGLPASPPACRLGELRHLGIRGRPDDTDKQDAMVPSIRDAMQST